MKNVNDIKLDNLTKLGSGSASDVFLLDQNTVLVVGKREDCFANYQSLFEKSKLLEDKITTIKYPKIKEIISPCQNFKFGAMVEDYVQGTELKKCVGDLSNQNKTTIGKDLALFLNQLHSIEIAGNKQEEIEINISKFDRSVALLSNYLSKENLAKLQEIKQRYIKFMQAQDFCITHGDLNAGNILISPDGSLAGIIDFGNMEYYVKEVEFAHMYFFDKLIYDGMTKNYNKSIRDEDVVLIELVMRIRHFKNIVNFAGKREECLNNIVCILDKI